MKLNLILINLNTPIIRKEPGNLNRNGFSVFEYRYYRFKVIGNSEMFKVSSGGGAAVGDPPLGYIEKDFLYIRIITNEDLSNDNKEKSIIEQIKTQKLDINKCITDQRKKIDNFIIKTIPLIEGKINEIKNKNKEKEEFNNSLNNKLSEL